MTQRETAALTKLGKTLDAHQPVQEALGRGDILADQAKVIVEAVDALPDDVGTTVKDQARDHLLAEAAHWAALHGPPPSRPPPRLRHDPPRGRQGLLPQAGVRATGPLVRADR
jgi:hypothetical protein